MTIQAASPGIGVITADSGPIALAAAAFNERLQNFKGNGIGDLSPAVLATKRTEEAIRAVLRSPELRTAMILDPEGSVESYAIVHAIPSHVVIVGVRPSWEEHKELRRKDMIAVTTASLLEGDEKERSPFDGQIDILFRYHQGTNDKSHLELADSMLSKHGHYVELFVPADGSHDRIVTYYSRQEITRLVS